ncbi:MAG TPA: hypothetical protein VGG28_11295 [Kofleriaceae bacterium]|jgi:hypothetical protein
MWRLGILLAVASCGRLGFTDLSAEVTPDASGPSSDAAPSPLLLACGAPQRFAFDTDQNGVGVAVHASGIDVFDADSGGVLTGYSFELGSDGSLHELESGVVLGTNNASGEVGGAAIGDQVVLASTTNAMPAGTTVFTLDDGLATVAAPMTDTSDASSEAPIASNGSVMMLAQMDAGSDAIVRLVSPSSGEASATTVVGASSVAPYYENAMATASGFALGYGTAIPSSRTQLALLDASLNITTGPFTLDAGLDMYAPWFAYSATLDKFLVTWHQKDVTSDDDTWAMIVDSTLNIVVQPFEVAPFSTNVVAAADADGFWLAYHTYTPASIIAASHVAVDGTVTARPVTSSGGTPVNWNVVERDGQAILVWTETGGSGPNLYLDPLCN